MSKLASAGVIALASLALTGCATTSFADYAEAANALDPGCKKDVRIQATPMLFFGFPVPVISGTYWKSCGGTEAGPPALPPAP